MADEPCPATRRIKLCTRRAILRILFSTFKAARQKKIVVSEQGKEAVVALFGAGDFFGKRWGADVRWYQIFPQLRMIPHPRCVCDSDMRLTCIEPDGFGHDRRIFECPRCKHWTVEIIKYGARIDIPTACPLPIP